jgi:DDE family transposase
MRHGRSAAAVASARMSRSRAAAEARRRRTGRAFDPDHAPTIDRVVLLLTTTAPDVGRWLAVGLALLTVAMLQLWRGARSGHGGLTLCALSRTLPLDESEKMRSKRLYRFLRNRALDGTVMTPLLVRLALGDTPHGWIPIVVDQTTIRGTQVLMAGVRVAHRVLPVAFACFEYATIRTSQNVLEQSLFLLIASCLPPGCKPVFVLDRGYARASLLRYLRSLNIPFIVRGRSQTIVRVGDERLSLGRLSHRVGRPCRYTNVAYQDTSREPIDVVVFHDRTFKEPWFLLVPAGSTAPLPTDAVVDLYRERMHIELTFRDWKTHLGIRGLRLEADIAPRLGRLLLALSLAYILAILLGAGPLAADVRAYAEVLRSTPRHGTRRRLGALSIGILALSLGRFVARARDELDRMLAAFAAGVPAWVITS